MFVVNMRLIYDSGGCGNPKQNLRAYRETTGQYAGNTITIIPVHGILGVSTYQYYYGTFDCIM